jgi:hypothetical protein
MQYAMLADDRLSQEKLPNAPQQNIAFFNHLIDAGNQAGVDCDRILRRRLH